MGPPPGTSYRTTHLRRTQALRAATSTRVFVAPPSGVRGLHSAILRGLKERYEVFHARGSGSPTNALIRRRPGLSGPLHRRPVFLRDKGHVRPQSTEAGGSEVPARIEIDSLPQEIGAGARGGESSQLSEIERRRCARERGPSAGSGGRDRGGALCQSSEEFCSSTHERRALRRRRKDAIQTIQTVNGAWWMSCCGWHAERGPHRTLDLNRAASGVCNTGDPRTRKELEALWGREIPGSTTPCQVDSGKS